MSHITVRVNGLIGRERGERGLLPILRRQKMCGYCMHMRGQTICEFTVTIAVAGRISDLDPARAGALGQISKLQL